MKTTQLGTRIAIKNILYLTDFSESAAAALPFATALAREYGAVVHARHVLVPAPYIYTTPELTIAAIDAEVENAREQMERVDSRLAGVPHDVSIIRDASVREALDLGVANGADMIVVGTHGRTGARKLVLGSVAEDILRRSPVPVLTIGPWARNCPQMSRGFVRVLFATDFSPQSLAAAPYAISLAEENRAELILLHAIPRPPKKEEEEYAKHSVANALHRLWELVPRDVELWCRPEAVVEFGDPSQQILRVAEERQADLIVLGVHDTTGDLGAAIHLGTSIAHKVVAHADCAVLTVRGDG